MNTEDRKQAVGELVAVAGLAVFAGSGAGVIALALIWFMSDVLDLTWLRRLVFFFVNNGPESFIWYYLAWIGFAWIGWIRGWEDEFSAYAGLFLVLGLFVVPLLGYSFYLIWQGEWLPFFLFAGPYALIYGYIWFQSHR